ncbi:MAG TPA: UbiH/UbiF family hydroxylase [Methylophilaceae bacterium]|nr:UbiH/UbiF family hydroxylase [Methylophilaceae bacterium]
MSLNQDYDVIVIGGGLVGAATALALAHSGLKLALVEASPEPSLPQDESWDSRMYAISPGNMRFLDSLGAWKTQQLSRITPIEAMRIWGDEHAELEFSAYEASVPALGYIAESRQIQKALWGQMRQVPEIALLSPAQCISLAWEASCARLVLSDGTRLSARLILGADGGNSWVRTQAGIEANTRDYGQLGVVANFATGVPSRNIARQWFRNDGVLAWLPLPGNRMSMVWSTDPAHARELLAMSPEVLCATVAEAGGNLLGPLSLITPAAAFPLRLQNAEVMVKSRLALVGDAAHLVHPLAGQGVNLGFHDVIGLTEVLRNRNAQADVGDYALLRRYERSRKMDISAMQVTTTGLHALFGSGLPGVGRLRNLGMAFTNRQQWLKRRLMAHAMI